MCVSLVTIKGTEHWTLLAELNGEILLSADLLLLGFRRSGCLLYHSRILPRHFQLVLLISGLVELGHSGLGILDSRGRELMTGPDVPSTLRFSNSFVWLTSPTNGRALLSSSMGVDTSRRSNPETHHNCAII